MKYRWMALFLALLVSVGAFAATPAIVEKNGQFTVTFDKGAVWACTVYQMQRVTEDRTLFPDGRYTPRHCWALDEEMTSYPDDWNWILTYDADWKVWAEIGYPKGGEIVYAQTNVIDVHR